MKVINAHAKANTDIKYSRQTKAKHDKTIWPVFKRQQHPNQRYEPH